MIYAGLLTGQTDQFILFGYRTEVSVKIRLRIRVNRLKNKRLGIRLR